MSGDSARLGQFSGFISLLAKGSASGIEFRFRNSTEPGDVIEVEEFGLTRAQSAALVAGLDAMLSRANEDELEMVFEGTYRVVDTL